VTSIRGMHVMPDCGHSNCKIL